MPFKFLHAADLHLDTPFTGVAADAPEVAEAMRDASLQAFDDLVELALREEVTFLLLAGDVYDGPERGVRAQVRFWRGLERLSTAGISVFVAYGNHDPLEGLASRRALPPGVHAFGSDAVQSHGVEVRGERVATVHGLSYARREEKENLALRFARGSEAGLHLGVLHASVGTASEHAPYSPCTVADLQRSGMDYWALGHIHRRGIVHGPAPWIAYPGNLQGRSLKPSEQGPKGALLVTVDSGRHIQEPRFVALDRVRTLEVELDLAQASDLPAVPRLLLDRMESLRDHNEGRGLIIRVVLAGRCGLHAELLRPGCQAEILSTLRSESRDLRPFVYWEGLEYRGQGVLDRQSIVLRQDFSGEVLRTVEAWRQDGDGLEKRLALVWQDLRRHGLGSSDATGLLEEAEQLLLEALEGETR